MPPKGPLQSGNNANVILPTGKTIEETYQKKSQLEHILLRPDTYIGSIEKHTQSLWVYEDGAMVHRPVSYVPGLYKIFDEILVNAADNKQRDPRMDALRVEIDVEQNCISVYNNGDGVPVEMHQEEGVYVPELIFGHLLTSSNYDDTQKKTTGGRNGFGAKLTNIFSTEFVIETADGKRQKKYKQVFSNNMATKTQPVISKCKESENWTKVTFKADLAKFKMDHLENDVVALMKKRVVDLAGCLGKTVKVELNKEKLPIKSFADYCSLYLDSAAKNRGEPLPKIVEKVNARWEVCVSLSEGQFQQVSFVNSIATIKGGTHVEYVTGQITNYLVGIVNKKNKTANLKASAVKNHLWVFVNALIDNPAFDSQTKETLTLKQASFGSKCEVSDDFLKKVATKSGVVDSLLSWAEFKQKKELKKTDGKNSEGRITDIPKLDDANNAGKKPKSSQCTLILTEGDSAKTLALAGIAVVGRDNYGVFPLRGKLLNVREASHKQIMENAEIRHIKKIMGLKHGQEYNSTNVKDLRYGHLMIMTDQDHDGSHIKGLLINFIHSFWPSLLKVPSFLVEFVTPIIKATKGGRSLPFYSMPEYESWKESIGDAKGWTIKYYKGLGTSTAKEGQEYFKALEKHKKDFVWGTEEDGEAIELAFSKKKIEARKNWLRQFEPGTHLDHKEKLITYSDFVNKELILFSMADLQRSIPSMVDGLKPGQRKILFSSFKKNFITEKKVVQFAGSVSELSAYHHGEASLGSTIIGMAQDFVGSNNINLLQPNGQFGTRNQGGKDHASSRYIYTRLSPITRFLFPKDDDGLLAYLNEDGQSIEPTWYMPTIPTVLVNGSEGIGTGWSSYVPNYNPRDIIANIRRLMNGEPMEPIDPWYRGFKGAIEKTATKENGASYTATGVLEEINEVTVRVTELPIRKWTQDYKEFLESMMAANDPFIMDFRDYSDDTSVYFEIGLSETNLAMAKQEGLLKKFKLTTTISTSNMHLFDANGVIKKYDTPEQIIEEFFHLRLEYYEKRKGYILNNLQTELLKLDNKVRFILGVVEGSIIVSNRKRSHLFLELKEKGFTPFPKKKAEPNVAGAEDNNTEETEEEQESSANDYEYLLSMAIGTLTLEKVKELCAKRDEVRNHVEELRKSTPAQLWTKDLDALEEKLDAQDANDAEAEVARNEMRRKAMGGDGSKPARKAPRKYNKKTKASNTEESAPEPMEISESSAMETSTTVPEAVLKPKGKKAAAPKKAPARKGKAPALPMDDDNEVNDGEVGKKAAGPKKAPARKGKRDEDEDEDEDEEVLELKDRLAAYNLGSSPVLSEMTEPEVQRREPTRRAAAIKAVAAVTEISDDDVEAEVISDDDEEVEEMSDDEDFDVEVESARKGRKKPAASKAPAPAATKKRGPAAKSQVTVGQKLITEVLKPVGISPEKKVRRMRPSPFNKKSGSVMGRLTENQEKSSPGSGSGSTEESAQFVAAPRATRPQRRGKQIQVLSDSESEPELSDDSDFNEDDD